MPPRVAAEWRAARIDAPVLVTSSVTRQGLAELGRELDRRVPIEAPAPAVADPSELAEHRTFRPAPARGFQVERADDGTFRVSGEGIERLLARHDLGNDEALAHIESRLRRLGVIRALVEHGFTAGDDVEIAGVVFDLDV